MMVYTVQCTITLVVLEEEAGHGAAPVALSMRGGAGKEEEAGEESSPHVENDGVRSAVLFHTRCTRAGNLTRCIFRCLKMLGTPASMGGRLKRQYPPSGVASLRFAYSGNRGTVWDWDHGGRHDANSDSASLLENHAA